MSSSEQSIHAVLFDYGLVLSGPPDIAARTEMEHTLSVSPAAFHEIYWKHRDNYDRGTLNGAAYWEHVARDLGRDLTAAQLDELIQADTRLWTQPNLPMIHWAADLQRAGIKTGILSNIGDAMEAGIRARFPWLEAFTHHTFSHRLGVAKPDPTIYVHAAEGLQTAPEHILFIDDRAENIAAATAVGMYTIQYTDHEHFAVALAEDTYHNLPKLEA
jgi:putative hydrolase of the HAD superfamily